nr:hypothetical protein Iba_chr02dCG2380 [Ipomoea batatas]GMC76892.1 hypothetical protein Iba_scaffold34559CG0010 [Ipomoea batatas]
MCTNGISKACLDHTVKLPAQLMILVHIFAQWMNCLWIFGHLLQHQKIITLRLPSILLCGFLGILLCPVTTKKWLDLLCSFSSQWALAVCLICKRFCLISFILFVHVKMV